MTLKLQGTNTVAAPGVSNDGNDGVVVGTSSIDFSIAGASKATLNSSGNLGIGTTSPSYSLTVYKASGATISYVGSAGSTSNDYGLSYVYGGSHYLNAQCYGTGYGYYCGSASQSIQYGNYANAPITFITNNNERARITSDGVFCVGGTAFGASGALTIKPNYDDGAAQVITERANTTNVSIVWEMKNNGGQVGRIEHDHTSAALVSGSDYRLKENDVAISDGITRVKQLRPIRFNWKAEPSKTVDGFFAHEVQSIVPEAVSGEKDAVDEDDKIIMQGMVTERLVPLLTAALKEAIGKIEVLETKVAALEGS